MAAPSAGNNDGGPRVMWRGEAVRYWEDLFDSNPDVAEELFFASLLRDARAEQARRGWKGPGHRLGVGTDDAEEEEEAQRRARVFQPWQPPAPGTAAMPPPPLPLAAAPVSRTVVLGLRAPPHLASTHGRKPPAAAPPERVNEPPAV